MTRGERMKLIGLTRAAICARGELTYSEAEVQDFLESLGMSGYAARLGALELAEEGRRRRSRRGCEPDHARLDDPEVEA